MTSLGAFSRRLSHGPITLEIFPHVYTPVAWLSLTNMTTGYLARPDAQRAICSASASYLFIDFLFFNDSIPVIPIISKSSRQIFRIVETMAGDDQSENNF